MTVVDALLPAWPTSIHCKVEIESIRGPQSAPGAGHHRLCCPSKATTLAGLAVRTVVHGAQPKVCTRFHGTPFGAEDGTVCELDAIYRDRKILHLFYAGCALNYSVPFRDYGSTTWVIGPQMLEF